MTFTWLPELHTLGFLFISKTTFLFSCLCKLLLFPPISLHRHALEPLLFSVYTYFLGDFIQLHDCVTWLLSNPSPAQTSLPNSRFIHLTNYSTILSEYLINPILNKYLIIPNIVLRRVWNYISDLPLPQCIPLTAFPNSVNVNSILLVGQLNILE